MTTLFLVLMIFVLIYQWVLLFRVSGMNKHDKSLFLICQTRRNIMSYLRQKEGTLKTSDYNELINLLNMVSVAINKYRDVKYNLFRFKYLKSLINRSKDLFYYTKNEIRSIEKSMSNIKNPQITKFQLQFASSILYGIYLHTPFFILRTLIYLKFVSYKIKAKKDAKKYLSSRIENLEKLENWFYNKFPRDLRPKLK